MGPGHHFWGCFHRAAGDTEEGHRFGYCKDCSGKLSSFSGLCHRHCSTYIMVKKNSDASTKVHHFWISFSSSLGSWKYSPSDAEQAKGRGEAAAQEWKWGCIYSRLVFSGLISLHMYFKIPIFFKTFFNLGMVVHACNLMSREVVAGELWVGGHPGVHGEFKASLSVSFMMVRRIRWDLPPLNFLMCYKSIIVHSRYKNIFRRQFSQLLW
jgi:hypothetical protein